MDDDSTVRLGIGRLAAWAGITPRAIRHYHRTGVLPEPPRTAGGYRTYGLEDLARLLRVRRLTALGLPLARVAEVLGRADAPDRLREVLQALDADLERQELEVAERRRSLRVLLDAIDGKGSGEDADAQVERLRADLVAAFGRGPTVERELDVVHVLAAEAPEALPDVLAAYRRMLEDDAARGLSARMLELFERLGAADGAGEPVPGLEEQVARGLADLLRHALGAEAAVEADDGGDERTATLMGLVDGELTPGQRRAVARARRLLASPDAPREAHAATPRSASTSGRRRR